MITIRQNGFEISCDNPSEAAELLRQLQEQNVSGKTPWNSVRFLSFIESLGVTQVNLLKWLVSEERLSDEHLRGLLGIESNQQLSGVLSGISKQAAARDIPARAVFRIDNEYNSGKTTKYYVASPEFIRIAGESNLLDNPPEMGPFEAKAS